MNPTSSSGGGLFPFDVCSTLSDLSISKTTEHVYLTILKIYVITQTRRRKPLKAPGIGTLIIFDQESFTAKLFDEMNNSSKTIAKWLCQDMLE